MAVVNFPAGFDPLMETLNQQVGYRALKTQFENGYAQRASAGINNKTENMTLRFIVDGTQKTTLMTYFDALKGVDYVGFTIPGESTAKNWEATSFSYKPLVGNATESLRIYEVTFNLERTYSF